MELSPPPPQGSFLIYPESEAASFSEPQISRGIPQNRPIKLLVRVYVVKVSVLSSWLIPMATEVGRSFRVPLLLTKLVCGKTYAHLWSRDGAAERCSVGSPIPECLLVKCPVILSVVWLSYRQQGPGSFLKESWEEMGNKQVSVPLSLSPCHWSRCKASLEETLCITI